MRERKRGEKRERERGERDSEIERGSERKTKNLALTLPTALLPTVSPCIHFKLHPAITG